MKENIHFFSKNVYIKKEEVIEKIGRRGRLANEFAELNLPILPGFIIDADVASYLKDQKLKPYLSKNLKKFEPDTKKVFNDPDNPL